MNKQDNVLLDTCILMFNPRIIQRVNEKGGSVFISNTILDELDFNKKGTEEKSYNVRQVLKELRKSPPRNIEEINSLSPLSDDVFSKSEYKGLPIYIIHRDSFKTEGNNDSKIIEIAKDYSLTLISSDNGMVVRANSAGVSSHFWEGEEVKKYSLAKKIKKKVFSRKGPSNTIKPFAAVTKVLSQEEKLIPIDSLPGIADTVNTSKGKKVKLKNIISSGGEGTIFSTDDGDIVCKIYHKNRLTDLRLKKIKLMITREIKIKGIAWPIDYVVNNQSVFVGYIMPFAKGAPLQTTVFVKPLLEKKLSNWSRNDLVITCLKFLEHVKYLHGLNVIVGDINPLNVLVNNDSEDLWLVDTDSFQVEAFTCPVGTVNFTPPEIQGKTYSDFLRTKDHELFSVATMLFMILLPGKSPYSQQGGGTPGENIKNKVFPYPFSDENLEKKDGLSKHHSSVNLPSGPYKFIWSNLSKNIKTAFGKTFKLSDRIQLYLWIKLLKKYQNDLERGNLNNELFPKDRKIMNGIDVHCSKCNSTFKIEQDFLDKLKSESKSTICPDCRKIIELERLASKTKQSPKSTKKKRDILTFRYPPKSTKTKSSRSSQYNNTKSNYTYTGVSPKKHTRNSAPGKNDFGMGGWIKLATILGLGFVSYAYMGVFGIVLYIMLVIFIALKAGD